MDQPHCPMPGRPVPDCPDDLGSGTARMAMEGSAMAIDAPGSGARGSRDDAWASYVAPVPPPLTIDHFQESMDKAKVLQEALENAETHVSTVAREVMALMIHKDSVAYASVVVSLHTLQCH